MQKDSLMYGYAGRVGVVDLDTREVRIGPLDEDLGSRYLGGRGFVAKWMLDLIPRGADPLGPDNIFCVAVGPLNGTLAPTSARFTIGAKSPLTGLLGSGNAGGFWSAGLKWAGFDGLIIRGRADSPVYLLVKDNQVRICSADRIWGRDTSATEKMIREEQRQPSLRIASIGLAGENRVLLANVIADRWRAAGRGGLGAVMGSKNLKAIAVGGRGSVPVYDPTRLWEEAQDITRRAIEEKGYFRKRWNNGAYGAFRRWTDSGAQITRNAQQGVFPEAGLIDGDAFNQRARVAMRACANCPLPCWVRFVVPDGPYAGLYGEELTATTLKEVGARCGITDLDAILQAHKLMDRYALDTISAPSAIAFAMECYQHGLITEEDTGGLRLPWGRADVFLELIHQMAHNDGFGAELGQGVRRCAKRWGRGTKEYALHVKGMEVVGTDPRGYPAWGLGYATSSRGACHMRAYSVFEYGGMTEEEMLRIAGTTDIGRRFSWEGKGRAVAYLENMRCVGDSLELCDFLTRSTFGFPEQQVGLLSAATGATYAPEELTLVGERIYNMERLFNLREGLTPADDTLPRRFLEEPLEEGPSRDYLCPLEPMLVEYYAVRDWDRETGYPSRRKMAELGLSEVQAEGKGGVYSS
jgi:aldehyde:ferredoxin oxidoreductase